MSEDDDLLRDFLTESTDNLDQLDQELVALERDPANETRLAAIFRCVHTLKGAAGFFGFVELQTLAHAGETLLARLRAGELRLDSPMTSALLGFVDAVRRILVSIETTRSEGSPASAALVELLTGLAAQSEALAAPMSTALPSLASPLPDATIRVDIALLDRVMNLVGELVVARNQIVQLVATLDHRALAHATQRLDLLTTDLQAGVMKTRMQPVGNAWAKLPRLVRDLAETCGKRVRLELEGIDTELDRTIMEAIRDPLTHALRNAIDHGIESPERRVATGKPETGRLLLRAFHECGQVHIEVADDGAGLDLQRIRARAQDRGLVTAERAAGMAPDELAALVFQPGFSTADRLTTLSGRGVGMDVVKTNIERVGGTVTLSSRPGNGTTLQIRVPLTLAVVPALVVTSGGQRFAIPQVSLRELVRLEGAALGRIEHVQGTPFYRLRGELLPIVYLDRTLELAGEPTGDVLNIVVLEARDNVFGLVVNRIEDSEEIVVKPLGKELGDLRTFSGATVMGDGRVALILDVVGLAERAHLFTAARRPPSEPAADAPASRSLESLLLFQVGALGRMAIPMATVRRLESISRSDIETVLGGDVVQHRGAILPLIDVRQALWPEQPMTGGARGASMMIVCADEGGTSVGLLVDQILDIVEDTITIRQRAAYPGTVGAAVVQGKVTDLLDVADLVRRRAKAPSSRQARLMCKESR